jgi:hypothetical protein
MQPLTPDDALGPRGRHAALSAVAVAAARPILNAGGIPIVELDLDTGEVLSVHDLSAYPDDLKGMPDHVAFAIASFMVAFDDVHVVKDDDVHVIGWSTEAGARVMRAVEVVSADRLGEA